MARKGQIHQNCMITAKNNATEKLKSGLPQKLQNQIPGLFRSSFTTV